MINEAAKDLLNKGAGCYRRQQYEEAVDYFDQAINLEPESYEGYFWKSVVLQSMRKYGEAIAYSDKALLLAPASHEAAAQRLSAVKAIDSRFINL